MTSVKRKKKQKIPFRALLRGTLLGIAASVILVLILTLLLYFGWLQESAIPIVNTGIKIVASLVCGMTVAVGKNRGGWQIGGIAAVCAQLLTWVGMSAVLGNFTLSWNVLADLLMSFAIGAATAALFRKLNQRA